MGYIRHHAIIVTSWHDESLEGAYKVATDLGMTVTPIVSSRINHYRTFLVCPDGSKEGWSSSDEGDDARAALVAWLARGDGDNPPWCEWAEVQYGDEAGIQGVLNASRWEHAAALPHGLHLVPPVASNP